MIKFENPNGYIEITNAYFATLVGRAAQSCFGVTGMVNGSAYESIVSAIKSKATGEKFNQGVYVKSVDGQLQIERTSPSLTVSTSLPLWTASSTRCATRWKKPQT